MFIVQRGNNFFERRLFEGIPEQTLTNLRGVSFTPSFFLQDIAHFDIGNRQGRKFQTLG